MNQGIKTGTSLARLQETYVGTTVKEKFDSFGVIMASSPDEGRACITWRIHIHSFADQGFNQLQRTYKRKLKADQSFCLIPQVNLRIAA